jgi:hypothetical protein
MRRLLLTVALNAVLAGCGTSIVHTESRSDVSGVSPAERPEADIPGSPADRGPIDLWMGWSPKDPIATRHPRAWLAKSWSFNFASEFPWFGGDPNQGRSNPAPLLVSQIVDLLERFVIRPQNASWKNHWAKLYDRRGRPRYAINLLHVASNQLRETEDAAFAEAFDLVAEKVRQRTGLEVGFTLDPMPLKREGDAGANQNRGYDEHGDRREDPRDIWRDTYHPDPKRVGAALAKRDSVLAIQAFNSEIWAGAGNCSEDCRLAFKDRYLRRWLDSGVPVILDVSPGYFAAKVFPPKPGGPPPAVWGYSDFWFNAQSRLKDPRMVGLAFNTWNGYTEGYAGMALEGKTEALKDRKGDGNRFLRTLFSTRGFATTGTSSTASSAIMSTAPSARSGSACGRRSVIRSRASTTPPASSARAARTSLRALSSGTAAALSRCTGRSTRPTAG